MTSSLILCLLSIATATLTVATFQSQKKEFQLSGYTVTTIWRNNKITLKKVAKLTELFTDDYDDDDSTKIDYHELRFDLRSLLLLSTIKIFFFD